MRGGRAAGAAAATIRHRRSNASDDFDEGLIPVSWSDSNGSLDENRPNRQNSSPVVDRRMESASSPAKSPNFNAFGVAAKIVYLSKRPEEKHTTVQRSHTFSEKQATSESGNVQYGKSNESTNIQIESPLEGSVEDRLRAVLLIQESSRPFL